jgi:hypothetical protein
LSREEDNIIGYKGILLKLGTLDADSKLPEKGFALSGDYLKEL